jgi:hypothetical protein
MNTVYFWDDIDTGFARLRRMVRTRVVLGIAPPSHLHEVGFAQEGFRVEEVDWYAERLGASGFTTRIVEVPGSESSLLVGEP